MAVKSMLAVLCLAILACGPAWAEQTELLPAAEALAQQVQADLEGMDRALAQAARDLASRDLTGPEAREVLRALFKACPLAINVCVVDRRGRMVTIEPKGYHHFEGADISAQEQVKLLWQSRRPVMSRVFTTVEGVEAVDIEHPVLAGGGEPRGAVSLIFSPETLLAADVRKVDLDREMEPWALDADGRILYDQDRNEVDRLLFSDEIYQGFPELLAIGRRMIVQPKGEGCYSFPARGERKAVTKACAWAPAELHGVWWRLVVARQNGK